MCYLSKYLLLSTNMNAFLSSVLTKRKYDKDLKRQEEDKNQEIRKWKRVSSLFLESEMSLWESFCLSMFEEVGYGRKIRSISNRPLFRLSLEKKIIFLRLFFLSSSPLFSSIAWKFAFLLCLFFLSLSLISFHFIFPWKLILNSAISKVRQAGWLVGCSCCSIFGRHFPRFSVLHKP